MTLLGNERHSELVDGQWKPSHDFASKVLNIPREIQVRYLDTCPCKKDKKK